MNFLTSLSQRIGKSVPFFFLFIILGLFYLQAQNSSNANNPEPYHAKVPRIDPRQFVEIYLQPRNQLWPGKWKIEQNSIHRNRPSELIAFWQEETLDQRFGTFEKGVFKDVQLYQKLFYLDPRDILFIQFNKDSLANALNFAGTFTIGARLDDREIEVSPYTSIGQERTPIITEHRPPLEIADRLLKLIIQSQDLRFDLEDFKVLLDAQNQAVKEYQASLKKFRNNEKEIKNELISFFKVLGEISISTKDEKTKKDTSISYLRKRRFPPDGSLFQDSSMFGVLQVVSKLTGDEKIKAFIIQEEDRNISELITYTNSFIENEEKLKILESVQVFSKDSSRQVEKRREELLREIDDEIKISKMSLYRVLDKVSLINNYFDYFLEGESDSDKTLNAYLQISGMDNIQFDQVKTYLDLAIKKLGGKSKDDLLNDPSLNKHFLRLDEAISYLSYIESTVLAGILTDSLNYNSDFFSKEAEKQIIELEEKIRSNLSSIDRKYMRFKNDDLKISEGQAIKEEIESLKEANVNMRIKIDQISNNYGNFLQNNQKDFQYLKETLAKKAGEILFKHLWFATIDLGKADAEAKSKIDGRQVLQIYLLWSEKDNNNSRKDSINKSIGIILKSGNASPKSKESLSKPVELNLASFKIKKIGWEASVSASPMLIYRFNENLVRSDVLNSTQFYPAAGTVLRIGYHNDKRIYPRRSSVYKFLEPPKRKADRADLYKVRYKKVNPLVRTMKSLEPSFGVHVSLLDFYRTEEANPVEFGLGLSLGLFQDRISFLGGYNLNVQREQPWYMGIGFDFVDIFNSKQD